MSITGDMRNDKRSAGDVKSLENTSCSKQLERSQLRISVPIHTHRRCVDCGRFVKSVRCDGDHKIDNFMGLLCDPCYNNEIGYNE